MPRPISATVSTIANPLRCEVLVVGAGPAGSACARWLALAGVDVLLIDQFPLGRDKTCGDALIPDAHAALARLGVLDAVLARAQHIEHLGCIGPRGGRVDVPGTLAVLPRRELDALLCRAAQDAGATLLAPARFASPLCDDNGRVVGAQVRYADHTLAIHARWVVLATGAVPTALKAAMMCTRPEPNGMALRGYVHAPHLTERIRAMEVVWSRALRPGYGWIFPAPGGCFNIGVGVDVTHAHRSGRKTVAKKAQNLRSLFQSFCTHHGPAAELMRTGELMGPLKGAPLRCNLAGARWTRPGLLVTGEAAGSTYAFTGEGIGKALETGLLAASSLLAGHQQQWTDHTLQRHYEDALRALKPKFDLYQRANRVNAIPWLADLVIWRAQRSERLRRRMSGVLNETSNPGNLFSLRGFTRLLLE